MALFLSLHGQSKPARLLAPIFSPSVLPNITFSIKGEKLDGSTIGYAGGFGSRGDLNKFRFAGHKDHPPMIFVKRTLSWAKN